ncbi:lipopolysaccharide biosynthesis protein [Winogradskyella forsetii]|uniref:lipopolysaccharide biosynthesis protein n=1 Tax=Winogradskyella forsetii TaxID=2686077 RepID=UPI0015BD3CFF|nr:lipopolysaccharide biosynthesis protein [Winogradskyella forsetii]
MSDNLKTKTTSAFSWALGGQLSNQIIGFVITLVLARLLTPEEFGLASLVMVVNLIGQIFIDAGISSGLIRNKTVNNTELSSFFWLNIIIGVIMMLLVFMISTFIANLYESENLAPLLQLSSLQFFLSSLGLIPMVLRKRDIDFRFLSQLDVGVNLSSGLITILLAFLGFGVYSLIFRSIISGIVNAGFLWGKTSWRPTWVFSYKSIKPTLNYSTGILGLSIVNTISSNLSTILIGKVFSVATIGIYNRAANTRGLILKNFGPLFNKVLFPVLSKIQDDEVRLQSYYLKAIQMVSLLAVFFMALLYLFSDTIIYYLYGEQWTNAAPMLKILSVAGLVLPISNINLNLFMVKGKSRFLMSYELAKHILSAIVMVISINYGMEYFLYSLVAMAYLFFFMNITLTYKKFKFSIRAQLMAFTSKLIPALLLVIAIELLILPKEVSLTYMLIVSPIFTIIYFVSAFLIDKELYFLIRDLVKPKLKQVATKLSNYF